MKKIKLFSFVILVVGSLYWLVNIYTIPYTISLVFDDVISNDAIRSTLNFSFYQGVKYRDQNVWRVKFGELKYDEIDDTSSDSRNNEPYFPYSNISNPFSYEFEQFEISDTLTVDFPVELEPAGLGTRWVYAYPKKINTKLFYEFETDLTLPIENNEVVCAAKIKNNQEAPVNFNDCYGDEYMLWLQNRRESAKVVYAETENYIYWSLSGTDGLEGMNHIYVCVKGRFDKSVAISSWDNQEKTVVNVAVKNDKIILICTDRFEEYDKDGQFINSHVFNLLDGLPSAEIKDDELIIKYYNATDPSIYYNNQRYFNAQAVQSIDLGTNIVYDYNLIQLRDMKYKDSVMFKKGRVYLLINEENAIRIEVYEDYEKIYEGMIHYDDNNFVKGMVFSNVRWR